MGARVLYADVDGTMVGPLGNFLWDSQRSPTLAAAEALVRAAREGLEVVALTGRARAGMFEFARVLGLQSWICELGGIRIYDRGDTVVHEHGAFPGGGVPTAELHRAVELLLEAYPGRLEEHSPWNATRESSFLLRGDVDPGEAEARLAGSGPSTSCPGACRRRPASPPTGPTGPWSGPSAPSSATPPPTSSAAPRWAAASSPATASTRTRPWPGLSSPARGSR